jgi:hypothetical protein
MGMDLLDLRQLYRNSTDVVLSRQVVKRSEVSMAAGHVESGERSATRLVLYVLHVPILDWSAMGTDRDQFGWMAVNWKKIARYSSNGLSNRIREGSRLVTDSRQLPHQMQHCRHLCGALRECLHRSSRHLLRYAAVM